MATVKKHVFVSSSEREMKEFISMAGKAIEQAGMEAVRMRPKLKSVPSDQNPIELNEQVVRDADYFVGLYGFELGSFPSNSEKSYLELEYEWAKDAELPCIFYIPYKENYSGYIPVEQDRRMVEFKEYLKTNHIVRFLTTPDELYGDLTKGLKNLESTVPPTPPPEPGAPESISPEFSLESSTSKKPIPELKHAEKILLKKFGSTSVYIQYTKAPWLLRRDAFSIPVGGNIGLGGGHAKALLKYLGAKAWESFRTEVSKERKAHPGFAPENPLLIKTPSALLEENLPPYIFLGTAFKKDAKPEHAGTAAAAIVKMASENSLKRIAISLMGSGGGRLDSGAVVESMFQSIANIDSFGTVEEVTITTLSQKAINAARKAAETLSEVPGKTSALLTSERFKGIQILKNIMGGKGVVKRGRSGEAVRAVQEALITAGCPVGETGADGIFGFNTENAVRKFQKDNSLLVDGIVGPDTLKVLDTINAAAGKEPTSPLAPERAEYRNDQEPTEDKLDMVKQAERFARLFIAKDAKPPLSLGLFGNWGVGKSYFMQLMKTKIEEIIEKESSAGTPSPYVQRVAHIEFNAWHYLDADLWANLAIHIFDGLAEEIAGEKVKEEDPDKYTQIRCQLRTRVESSKESKQVAEERQRRARTNRQEAAEKLAKIRTHRANSLDKYEKLRFTRLFEENDNYKNIRETIREIAQQFGLPDSLENIDDMIRLSKQFKSLHGRFRRIQAAFGDYFKEKKVKKSVLLFLLFVVGVVLLGPAVGWLLPKIFDPSAVISKIGGTAVQVGTFVTTAVAWIGKRLTTASATLDQLGTTIDQLEVLQSDMDNLKTDPEIHKDENNLLREIETFEAEIQGEEEKIKEADRRIAEAEAELQRINAGGLVYDFVKDRSKDPQYLKRLGIISIIREDFQKLEKILKDWNWHGEKPVERIVLYIDDLDRCHPDRVVQVLQAVHLLLGLPLFNVVVAVDARWLERSLYKAYLPEAVAEKAAIGQLEETPDFSPQQYLEKIFQIPYSLPNMSKTGFLGLVDDLITTRSEYEKDEIVENKEVEEIKKVEEIDEEEKKKELEEKEEAKDEEELRKEEERQKEEEKRREAERLKEEELQKEEERRKEEARKKALTLEDYEQTYIQKLYRFVETPRLTKRLINIYRLIRVTAVDKGFDSFLGSETHGQYRAALILLAINTGYPVVSTRLLRLIENCEEEKSWPDFLKAIDPDAYTGKKKRPKWAQNLIWTPVKEKALKKILDHLKELDQNYGMPDDLEAYKEWAPEVGRYAFHWHLQSPHKKFDE